MPATKRGVYHNLKESHYAATNGEIVLFFSSRVYLKKFLDGYTEHRKKFIHRLSKLTVENPLNMETLADIQFYRMVEKRGFRALLKGGDITCKEIHQYALQKMTEKSTLDWSKTQKPKLGERLKTMK